MFLVAPRQSMIMLMLMLYTFCYYQSAFKALASVGANDEDIRKKV